MNHATATTIANHAAGHPKVGTVKVVEEIAPTAGSAYVLVGLAFPHQARNRTAFSITTESQWVELQEALG